MSTAISFLDLNNYQPLDTLSPDNLKEIATKLEAVELKPGDTVFSEGDRDDRHIFLHTGNVNLVKAGKSLKNIKAGTADARTAIAHITPRNLSCVAASDLHAGHIIEDDDVIFRRPGSGLPPKARSWLLGLRLNRNVTKGHTFVTEDFS